MTAVDPAPKTTARLGASYYKLLGASTISNLGDGIGLIAYPWLASAVTRNGLLIALVVVAQRLPWLLFSLPAGVITDRNDRRTLMLAANWARAGITLVVATAVLIRQGELAGPDVLDAAVGDGDMVLYGLLLAATLLTGTAEVLYDNSAQTFLPSIVQQPMLERANGRLWSVELVANSFIGPPLGALLLAAAFAVPFFVDAATFAASAALITLIPVKAQPTQPDRGARSWRAEAAEGFRWLWSHDVLRPMAISLGVLNMCGTMAVSLLVLFGQEVLGTSPTEFALLSTGGAAGGVIGGWAGPSVAARIGSGPSLALTLIGGGATSLAIGATSSWPLAWAMFAIFFFLGTLWNVITVSFRQSIIPGHLLGRVNSVYRFFGWGMMSVGAFLGGLILTITEVFGSRELALRMPWFVAGAIQLALLAYSAPRLTTAHLETAR